MMRWLLTYADMITLLLALFIILFSISSINKAKLQRLVKELSGSFTLTDTLNNPAHGQTTVAQDDLKAMQAQLTQYINEHDLQSKVKAEVRQDGEIRELVVTLLTDQALYDSGSAALRPETRRVLDAVNGQLQTRQNDIRVEGNTDDVPIATATYPTNWELSAARAANVTRYLIEHDGLNPQRVSLAGYAQYHPRFPNDTPAHRQANRRVEIVILDTHAGVPVSAADQEGL